MPKLLKGYGGSADLAARSKTSTSAPGWHLGATFGAAQRLN